MSLALVKFVRRHFLTCLILFSVFLAMLLGVLVRLVKTDWTPRQLMYIAFPGEIFLQLLRSLIIPLITTSLFVAVASLDIRKSKKIGGLSIVYYVVTTILAVQVGLALVVIIKPGSYIPEEGINMMFEEAEEVSNPRLTIVDSFLDLFRNFFPPNWVQATMFQYRTVLIPPKVCHLGNCTDISLWKISHTYAKGLNFAGIVVVSISVGVAAGMSGDKVKEFKTVVEEINMISMKITGWVIWLSPVGVFFLILSKFIGIDIMVLLHQLGLLILTVILGMVIQAAIVLPAASFILTRENPYLFIANMGEALAMAFGTASSSATLPITLRCCEENGIHPQIVGFVIPIGETINMNGTALYEAVAAVFISQIRGTALNFGHYVMISITATAASVGAAGIPNAGLVTMVMVLDAIGLPPEDISFIIALDWLLDRFRTTVNVLGDAFGAQVVNHLCLNELQDDEENPTKDSED